MENEMRSLHFITARLRYELDPGLPGSKNRMILVQPFIVFSIDLK